MPLSLPRMTGRSRSATATALTKAATSSGDVRYDVERQPHVEIHGSVAVLTAHTAFEDPTTPPDAEKRESIELHALVFYG
ncbi:hypothetical protein EDB92DRAFT_1944628 [Lactarius akahatsu]|uniref:Uncharacterized protein n=1 Tax=Lactarius akahatsu TaxID=416441 RepID=A0AAD4LIV9_9AGAM|nr:hypothetical protein EDB92DRAFT_1944628 [Lactarius akahatsu]